MPYEGTSSHWLRFLDANKVAGRAHDFARGFSHSGVLAQATVAGQGVALVAYAVVHDDLQRGALWRVAARSLSTPSGYRFLVDPVRADAGKGLRLRAWLAEEMAAMQASLDASALNLRTPRAGAVPPP